MLQLFSVFLLARETVATGASWTERNLQDNTSCSWQLPALSVLAALPAQRALIFDSALFSRGGEENVIKASLPSQGSIFNTVCAYLVVRGNGVYRSQHHQDSFHVTTTGYWVVSPQPPSDLHYVETITLSPNSSMRIYSIPLKLRDADTFTVRVVVDYVDYAWMTSRSHTDRMGALVGHYVYNRASPGLRLLQNPVKISLSGTPLQLSDYVSLPVCTRADHPGRWVSVAHLKNTATSGLTSFFSAYKQRPLFSDQGWNVSQSKAFTNTTWLVWVPFSCRLPHVNYESFLTKVAPRLPLVHFYGSDLGPHLKGMLLDQCDKFAGKSKVCTWNSSNLAWEQDLVRFPNVIQGGVSTTGLVYFYGSQGIGDRGTGHFERLPVTRRMDEFQRKVLPGLSGFSQHLGLLRHPKIIVLSLAYFDLYAGMDRLTRQTHELVNRLTWTFPNAILVWKTGHHAQRSLQRRADLLVGQHLVAECNAYVWDTAQMYQAMPSAWHGNLVAEEDFVLFSLLSSLAA